MLHLLLPALMPSWRFFDRIGPAPSLEFALTASRDGAGSHWQALRSRPIRVSPARMIAGLVWNPRGNESLYLVSCAERLLDDPSPARADRLWRRVARIVRDDEATAASDLFLRVRVVETVREDGRLVRQVAFVSGPRRLGEAGGAAAR